MPAASQAAPAPRAGWPGDRGGHLWAKDHEAVTDDGTHIRYAVRGPHDGPWIACLAGYLCPDTFWRDIAPDLARDHRVVLFNHRGIGASTEAGGGTLPPDAEGYTIPRLTTDVVAVLEAEGARDVTVLGHSMGVQTALELWRTRPGMLRAMVLAAGEHASPFATMYGSRVPGHLFTLASMVTPALPRALGRSLLRTIELPVALPVARALRAVGDHTPWLGMTSYRAHMSRIDPRTAIWTARGMHHFDAGAWLHEVDVPTVVMVGTEDGWYPVPNARALAAALPRSDLEIIEGASHTLPLEFPGRVVSRIRELTETSRSAANRRRQ